MQGIDSTISTKKLKKEKEPLQLHQSLHRISNSKARLGHNLPRFLGNLRQRLDFAQLIRMLAELAKNFSSLFRSRRWEVVIANGDNARHDGDDLRQMLMQGR